MDFPRHLLPALLLLLGCLLSAAEADLVVVPGSASGIQAPGERVSWRVAGPLSHASFVVLRGGAEPVCAGDLDLRGQEVTASLDRPGTLLLEVAIDGPDGPVRHACGGAVIDPGGIVPAEPRPDDFDAFWAQQLALAAAIPLNPSVVAMPVDDPALDYCQVTLDGIDGCRIRGQLARPRGRGRLPALLIAQWAGVYGLPREFVLGPARQGWLAMNLAAHDLPIDASEEFYQRQAGTTLRDYPAIGNDDRERCYFRRMFLACSRAVDYLAERPDWDGRTILVTGTSQGGLQAIAVAALNPRVSAIIADQPAGCDHAGSLLGRAPGWPHWWAAAGKDPVAVRRTARYFDAVHFAPRVTCPALVGLGLVDLIARPEGILAAYNLLRGPKELVVMPLAGHRGGQPAITARAAVWQAALRVGGSLDLRP